MKEKVEVAAVQMNIAWLNPEKNLCKMLDFMKKANSEKKMDLIVFPELANTGYVKGNVDKEFGREYIKKSEKIPGPFTEALCEAAKKYGSYLVLGFCELHPVIPASLYNSAVLISPDGGVVGVYHKVHIPMEENHYFYPGNAIDVYRTEIGNIGMIICYDYLFPEVSRILSLKGAEIICAVLNGPKRPPYDRYVHIASTRAHENRNYFIICNRVGKEEVEFMGRTTIAGPEGEIVSQSHGEEEEIVYATFSNDKILEERAFQSIFVNRRPELYEQVVQHS
jgi:predicted amidohydrolase